MIYVEIENMTTDGHIWGKRGTDPLGIPRNGAFNHAMSLRCDFSQKCSTLCRETENNKTDACVRGKRQTDAVFYQGLSAPKRAI